MLILTVKQLTRSAPAFMALAAQQPKAGHQRLAYNLAKTLKAIRAENEEVTQRTREIYLRYGGETRKDGGVQIDLEKLTQQQRADFDVDLKSLAETTIEVWGSRLTIEQIEAAALTLSADEFTLLDWLFTEEEEETPKANSATP